jgi:hypothetical protein
VSGGRKAFASDRAVDEAGMDGTSAAEIVEVSWRIAPATPCVLSKYGVIKRTRLRLSGEGLPGPRILIPGAHTHKG